MLQLSSESHLVSERIRVAGNDGEALISAARGVFCALVLARFLEIEPSSARTAAALLEVPLLGVGVVGSAWTYLLARRKRLHGRALVALSLTDAMVCFASLATNVLWPNPMYIGILRMPDVAAFLPTVFVAVLRFSVAATVMAVTANLIGAAALIASDSMLNAAAADYRPSDVAMLAILLAVVSAATLAATYGARRLVQRTAHETSRLARARRQLHAVMREHHDVRSLLTAARLHTQQARALANRPDGHLQAISGAIEELAGIVEGIKTQTLNELALLDEPVTADASRAADVAAQIAAGRFPAVRFTNAVTAPQPVWVTGGERALTQALFNLLANAAEGDGTSGATCVRLHAVCRDERVFLHVDDDGPGFAAALLKAGSAASISTKPGGSGVGLAVVHDLARASGGSVLLTRLEHGGASVTLQLRAAR